MLVMDSFGNQLSSLVSSIASGVVDGLKLKITVLESDNAGLKSSITGLESKVVDLEKKLSEIEDKNDAYEQYSRRNCLRLSGLTKTPVESTDSLVLEIAKAVGANLTIDEID
ncbi:hypothetical protein DPMN_112349 [Dreissena polymorpha]|uniref:Uncharacterized protein n=1 Tax=Dreissena polymorpha TaxID=45954 RepID=A0A9D4KGN2_DREPO|nr:hypothetical protein DPMN_112349 [Dreissena polymorpha]